MNFSGTTDEFMNKDCNTKLTKCKEYALIVLLCILSYSVGSVAIKQTFTNNFYQQYFYPALVTACGSNAQATGPDRNDKVIEFLETKINKIECREVPHDIDKWPLGLQQTSQKYLIGTVGLLWRFTGIDWGVMVYINSLMYVVSMLLAFYIFKFIGINTLLSITATVFLIFSAQGLDYLPNYREYGKVPFSYASILLLVVFLLEKIKLRNYLFLSIISGVVVGVGVGFRADLIIFMPLLFLAIILANPESAIKMKWRIVAFSFFLISLILIGGIVLTPLSNGNLNHVILLGLMENFNSGLGISSNFYQFGNFYSDTFVEILSNIHNEINDGFEYIKIGDANYSTITFNLLFEMMTTFPADFIARFISSVILMLSMGYNSVTLSGFIGILSFAIVFINLVLLRKWRLVFLGYLVLLYICGFAFLQFMPRHYFHMQIVSIALLLGASQILYVYSKKNNVWKIFSQIKISNIKLFGVLFILMALPFVLLSFARYYQAIMANYISNNIIMSEVDPIVDLLEDHDVSDFKVFPIEFLENEKFKYMRADVKHCSADLFVNLNYLKEFGYQEFSRVIRFPASEFPTTALFPVFNIHENQTKARAVSISINEHQGCLVKLSFLKNLNSKIIPLNYKLIENFTNTTPYQEIDYHEILTRKSTRNIFHVPNFLLLFEKWQPANVMPEIVAPNWMLLD